MSAGWLVSAHAFSLIRDLPHPAGARGGVASSTEGRSHWLPHLWLRKALCFSLHQDSGFGGMAERWLSLWAISGTTRFAEATWSMVQDACLLSVCVCIFYPATARSTHMMQLEQVVLLQVRPWALFKIWLCYVSVSVLNVCDVMAIWVLMCNKIRANFCSMLEAAFCMQTTNVDTLISPT